ncbi:MAG TPA: ATP-binding cassette domain-containing protein [Gammaproteobacteria bacterium]|nr:ATP-binding cassette domain-containing protein [Gammaproteobacteria bacterium]
MENIVTRFGENLVHDDVSLSVREGEIYGLLGGSGSGKSTLLREMIMLLKPDSGSVTVLDTDVLNLSAREAETIRIKWGVLFQSGALYTSLTIAENIGIGLKEYTDIPVELRDDIVRAKISMVGLPEYAAGLYPSELSGGMVKRASLARALAMDPSILFLDEPTSGLDPVGAEAFDKLILALRDSLGFTVVMVTHDLDSIWTIVDRFCVLGDRKVIAEGILDDVMQIDHPVIHNFFKGNRGAIRSKAQYGK